VSQSPFATALVLSGVFLALFVLERLAPLRTPRAAVVPRLLVNLCVSALAIATAYAVVAPAVRVALRQSSTEGIGLLRWLEFPQPLEFVTGFALLDLSFYYWHRANHKIGLLWRLHNVHHIDPDLDVSTAFRFHFGEVALSAAFRVVQVVLLGESPVTFAMYELAFETGTLFHHSNVRLPLATERLLNKIFVTPRMHGIHHSHVRSEDNCNFSVLFSCWDRIHRTLRLNIAQSKIVIGIPAYLEPENNRVANVLILPFLTQRDYWRTVDGNIVDRNELEARSPSTVLEA